MPSHKFTNATWDGSTSRFSLEQLMRSVPPPVLTWARSHAKSQGRELSKGDLKLPVHEPDGTVNLNAVRAALASLGGARGGVDLPQDVKAAAQEYLEATLAKGKKESGMSESVTFSERSVWPREAQVDEEAGVLKGVKILGKDGNKAYSEGAIDKAYTDRIYEGAPICEDHPPKDDSPREVGRKLGEIRNVERRADGLYADAHFLKEHPLWPRIKEAAKRMPNLYGFSHLGRGKSRSKLGGKDLIEEITFVRSVDLVDQGATVKGLFEGEGSDLQCGDADSASDTTSEHEDSTEEVVMDWKDLTIEKLREQRPDLIEVAVKESTEAAQSKADREKLLAENKELREENDRYKTAEALAAKKRAAEKAIEEAKLPKEAVSEVFMESLLAAPDEEKVKALVADRKEFAEAALKQSPRSKEQQTAGAGTNGTGTASVASFKEATGW